MYRNDIPNIDLASSNLVYYLDHHLRGTGHEGIIEHPKDPKKARVRCLPEPHPFYQLDSIAHPAGEELRTRTKGWLYKGGIRGVIRLADLVRLGFLRISENSRIDRLHPLY